jgi:(4-(4-[2-(gamma-L-glutamylamino)ethyl]phenoxymethyl)furan-2-yl)methanamine synthase
MSSQPKSLATPQSTKINVIGCDVGGANLKLADCLGRCVARTFPMWRQPERLGSAIREMLIELPVHEGTQLAVTMTGELADCFATRREGVHQILSQVALAFAPANTHVYAVGNKWLTPAQARTSPWDVAASNWHALATWIGTLPEHPVNLVLDIGSTTVDIIPMRNDSEGPSPATKARTDRSTPVSNVRP